MMKCSKFECEVAVMEPKYSPEENVVLAVPQIGPFHGLMHLYEIEHDEFTVFRHAVIEVACSEEDIDQIMCDDEPGNVQVVGVTFDNNQIGLGKLQECTVTRHPDGSIIASWILSIIDLQRSSEPVCTFKIVR